MISRTNCTSQHPPPGEMVNSATQSSQCSPCGRAGPPSPTMPSAFETSLLGLYLACLCQMPVAGTSSLEMPLVRCHQLPAARSAMHLAAHHAQPQYQQLSFPVGNACQAICCSNSRSKINPKCQSLPAAKWPRWQRHRGPPVASEACQPWPLKSYRPLGLTAWPHLVVMLHANVAAPPTISELQIPDSPIARQPVSPHPAHSPRNQAVRTAVQLSPGSIFSAGTSMMSRVWICTTRSTIFSAGTSRMSRVWICTTRSTIFSAGTSRMSHVWLCTQSSQLTHQ